MCVHRGRSDSLGQWLSALAARQSPLGSKNTGAQLPQNQNPEGQNLGISLSLGKVSQAILVCSLGLGLHTRT